MITKYINAFATITILSLIFSGCTPGLGTVKTFPPPPMTVTSNIATSNLPPSPTAAPTSTLSPLPDLTLKPGDSYFSLDGQPAFILSRNLTGKTQADFDAVM